MEKHVLWNESRSLLNKLSLHNLENAEQGFFGWVQPVGKNPFIGFRRGCECGRVSRPVEFTSTIIQGSSRSRFAHPGSRTVFLRFSHYCLWCCDC